MSAVARQPMGNTGILERQDIDGALRHSRILDFIGLVRNIVGQKLSADDLELVAGILYDASEKATPLTKNYLHAELLARGRSRNNAQTIVDSLLK